MRLYEAMVILKAHREWLFDRGNLPKVIDDKVIEAIKVVESEVKKLTI